MPALTHERALQVRHEGPLTICLTPEERTRLATLYPPEPEPEPEPAPSTPRPQLVHPGPRPDIRGESHGMAVLTRELVTALRLEVAAGSTCRAAAQKRGLAWGTVVNAVSGRSWAWLKSPPPVVEARVHLTERIRKVMRSNVLVSWRIGDLAKRVERTEHGSDGHVGVGRVSDEHVRVAVHRLMNQGEVERTGRGLYRWGPPSGAGEQCTGSPPGQMYAHR